jgi:hypothetical protein
VQTATLEPNTTTIQNHFWDGSGDGISTFVQAGKNFSPDCLLKKKQNWQTNTNLKNIGRRRHLQTCHSAAVQVQKICLCPEKFCAF